MSSMRTSRGACEYCGGFDEMHVERPGGKVDTRKLFNYSYPSNLLPTIVETSDEERD